MLGERRGKPWRTPLTHRVTTYVIHALGLELEVIFNKRAVMVLPTGVNKSTGLAAALTELNVAPDREAGAVELIARLIADDQP